MDTMISQSKHPIANPLFLRKEVKALLDKEMDTIIPSTKSKHQFRRKHIFLL